MGALGGELRSILAPGATKNCEQISMEDPLGAKVGAKNDKNDSGAFYIVHLFLLLRFVFINFR